MTREGRPAPRRSRRLVVGLLVVALSGAGVGLLIYLSTTPRLTRPGRVEVGPARGPDEGLEALCEPLTHDTHLATCRAFVGRLNTYLDRHPEERPPSLATAERDPLRRDFGLTDTEWKEVNSSTFTPLDAHYLEECFLLRDAARSLEADGLPEKERARCAFDWVIRQVRLRESTDPASPPLYVLRRGEGSADERALVFCALLQQFDIPGCLITRATEQGARPWLVGAVVGTDVYLFEPTLGVPLPGPGGAEVATLAQVRRQPQLLAALDLDREFTYPVTPDQAENAKAHPACPLSALAPRMRYLQEVLAATARIDVRLAVDPAERRQRYRQAAVSDPVPPDGATPTRVLRAFLPPEQGGADAPPPGSKERRRAERYRDTLAAWEHFPPAFRKLEGPNDPARLLREHFFRFFEELTLKPGGARDLLLRGRLEPAIATLVRYQDELSRPELTQAAVELESAVNDWRSAGLKALADLRAAQRAAQGNEPGAAAALQQARERLQKLDSKEQVALVQRYIEAHAAPPLRREAAYLLALSKHEQAERTRDHDAWRSAAERWQRYLAEYPASPGEANARLLGARALAALGDTDAARALLQSAPPPLNFAERYACRYRARLMKGR